MRLHTEELPQVPRPKTVGVVSDMVGNQRVTVVLWKRQDWSFDLLTLLHNPVP